MSLVSWGDAWESNAWALYTWEPSDEQPEEEQTGSGMSRRARTAVRLKRYPLPEQVTPQPRDLMIAEIAARRAREERRQAEQEAEVPAGIPEQAAEIIRRARAMPLPPVTRSAVEAMPEGEAKWSRRQSLELSASRAKFQERMAATRELIRYEAELQHQLEQSAKEELDVVFVAAMMATEDMD